MTDMHRGAFDMAMRKQADLAYQFAALMAGKPNTYPKQVATHSSASRRVIRDTFGGWEGL